MHVRGAVGSATVIAAAMLAWAAAPFAQGAAPQAPPAGQGRGGGGGGGVAFGPPTVKTPYDDYTGFTKIFDGTFKNWVGETDVWSIQDGMLHADTTKTPGQHHIHYIGPGAVMRDFTLKVEAKLSATGANGGIQYRSRLLHPAHGGSIADPLGKPLPANITTMDQAVAAGITSAPPARGGGPGGGGGRAGQRAARQVRRLVVLPPAHQAAHRPRHQAALPPALPVAQRAARPAVARVRAARAVPAPHRRRTAALGKSDGWTPRRPPDAATLRQARRRAIPGR